MCSNLVIFIVFYFLFLHIITSKHFMTSNVQLLMLTANMKWLKYSFNKTNFVKHVMKENIKVG